LLLEGKIDAKDPGCDDRSGGRRVENFKPGFPVFGVLERKGSVKVEPLQELSAEAVLKLAVKTFRRGSIVYTGGWGRFDALMFCDDKHLTDHRRRFGRGDVSMNGTEGFLNYAKEKMNKFHGISKEKFPLYMKEMEFRYNHRRGPIFNTLVRYLCDLEAM
jgi:transposase